MPADPDWDHYRSFLAVVAEGSLSGAARALGLTQPTLARHIELLEAALGAGALFTRSPQGLRPTEAAERLLPHAETMAAAAAALRRAAALDREALRGVVRISASEVVGVEVLPPILRDIRRDHPQVAFELALSNASADLLRRDADIAVRMIRPQQAALVARKVGEVHIGLFAHRDYLARAGAPRSLEAIDGHAAIGFDSDTIALRALEGLGLTFVREDFAFRCDSEHAQLAALRAGFGIGGCQVPLARRNPALVRLFAEEVDVALETWIVMHRDLSGMPLMRMAFDRLAGGMRAYIAEASDQAGDRDASDDADAPDATPSSIA